MRCPHLTDQGLRRPQVRERFEERWRGHGHPPRPVKSAYDLEQHLQATRLRVSARLYVLQVSTVLR